MALPMSSVGKSAMLRLYLARSSRAFEAASAASFSLGEFESSKSFLTFDKTSAAPGPSYEFI